MALATEIYQEGLRLPPVRLVQGGELVPDIMQLFLANTRVADERRGDLLAQLAALRTGAQRIQELVERYGSRGTEEATRALQDYSERMMAAALRRLPAGDYRAVDWMDDDGGSSQRIAIRVHIRLRGGTARVDFSGTAAQVAGGINANYAVTVAAVLYALQLLSAAPIPANAGLLRPIELLAPPGSLVNAAFPAAVAGGNVETSQRIVDVVLKALALAAPHLIPAASSGTMTNLALGGFDPVRRRHFAYYETIAGGAGGGPNRAGAAAIQTHMTNTLNTPIEALESALPMRLRRYAVRRGSGGAGQHRGGDGVEREIELLAPAQVTLLSDRRRVAPYGLQGGKPGRTSRNVVTPPGGAHPAAVSSKFSMQAPAGEIIRLATPGGGGWGRLHRQHSRHRRR
jgi:N-methylhydantoinase B